MYFGTAFIDKMETSKIGAAAVAPHTHTQRDNANNNTSTTIAAELKKMPTELDSNG